MEKSRVKPLLAEAQVELAFIKHKLEEIKDLSTSNVQKEKIDILMRLLGNNKKRNRR